MASLGLAALLILAVAVLGTARVSRDQCSPSRYCPDGTKCCSDTLHCCPIFLRCCYNFTRCCLFIESAMNSTMPSYFDGSNEISAIAQDGVNAGNVDRVDDHDNQRLQETLQRIFPGLYDARRDRS